GEERYHSIKNALSYCYGDYVWIHDGVRPLVNEKTLNSCAKAIRKHDAVIPIIAVPDSLRRVQGSQSNAVPRSEYVFVQTPQCFKRDVILKAYNIPFSPEITDDASLVEQSGVEIKCVQGNLENIKITNKFDVKFAELYLG
ncbi:MAG: IspD/TarI family cytidylyltransferase, partial [Flavobacteriales bacterium]